MKLLPFFAETHNGNTDKDQAWEIQAPNLHLATLMMNLYIAGAEAYGGKIELRGLTAYKRKGTKYERLG